jgi:hypothetical protein
MLGGTQNTSTKTQFQREVTKNLISEMFIPSNTTYIILKFKLGYMFRPCGFIIRTLQFDEAVRHKQDNEQINNKQYIARRDPDWFTYTCICEIRVTDVTYLLACVEFYSV